MAVYIDLMESTNLSSLSSTVYHIRTAPSYAVSSASLKVLQPRKEGPDWRMYGSHAVLSVRGSWLMGGNLSMGLDAHHLPIVLVELVPLILAYIDRQNG